MHFSFHAVHHTWENILKKVAQQFGVLFLSVIMPIIVLAENAILNPGFENWSDGNPVDWISSNVPSMPLINATQSSDSHGGSSSARLEVLDFGGFPLPASLLSGDGETGFPCQERYESLKGFYKLQPQPEGGMMINVIMIQNAGQPSQAAIGLGTFSASSATADWTQFSAPISYFQAGDPDACQIQIVFGNDTTPGGLFWIDDLEFGAAPGGCCVGTSGNVDGDPSDLVDIGDLTALIDYLFITFAVPECLAEANVDGDLAAVIDIGDLTALIDYLFITFAPPADCL